MREGKSLGKRIPNRAGTPLRRPGVQAANRSKSRSGCLDDSQPGLPKCHGLQVEPQVARPVICAQAARRSEIRSAHMSPRRLRRTFCDACRLYRMSQTPAALRLIDRGLARSVRTPTESCHESRKQRIRTAFVSPLPAIPDRDPEESAITQPLGAKHGMVRDSSQTRFEDGLSQSSLECRTQLRNSR
jgi:hypothetical protein